MYKERSRKLVLVGSFFVALILLTFMVGPAMAANGPAIVVLNATCGMLDQYGKPTIDADQAQIVVSYNNDELNNSNVTLKCKVSNISNDSGNAIHWNINNTVPEFKCEAFVNQNPAGWVTEDWSQTISASGESTLTCKFKS